MTIPLPNEIILLAELFEKHKTSLFLVGGYVRSFYLGVGREDDIDLASAMKPDKVIDILKGTDYKICEKNLKTGVLKIEINGIKFEHATFRTESYAVHGEHMPCEISFIDNVNLDAERRDFSCNAIYYEILSGQIIDPYEGISDIRNKTIKSIGHSGNLFKDDAERILRMVRIACSCGFDIDEKTYYEAKRNVFRLKFLTKARVRKEFLKILKCDKDYPMLGLKSAHVRAINILFEMGAYKYIFEDFNLLLASELKMSNGLTIGDYTLLLLNNCMPENRNLALLTCCGALDINDGNKIKNGFSIQSKVYAEKYDEKFDFSDKEMKYIFNALDIFDIARKDKISLEQARMLLIKFKNDVKRLCDFLVSCRETELLLKIRTSRSEKNIKLAVKQAYMKKYAIEINQLRISKNDLKEKFGITDPQKMRNILECLLNYGAKKGIILNKIQNLKVIKKIAKK